MKTIAIIGGGFSGTLTAIHLLQKSKNVVVKLFNYDHPLAKGVAYSTILEEHLLNVPAGKMSAFNDDPDHFINWLKTQKEYAHYANSTKDNEFVPRLVYGKYLSSVLEPYLKNDQLEIINSKVIGVRQLENDFSINLKNNISLKADKIVLAMGNFEPAKPKINNTVVFENPHYFNNPWNNSYLENCDKTKNILLIGTGLTMVDCVLSLKRIGFAGHIYISSPRGYAPESHQKTEPYPDFYDELKGLDLAGIFKAVRKHIKVAESQNNSWHSVIDALRPHAQKIWLGFSEKEKQQYISHLRHIWGVVRHRLPKDTYSEFIEFKENGHLEIVAGRINTILEKENEFTVVIQLRKNNSVKELKVSRIVNCTGPQINYAELKDELIVDLLNSKLISSSPLKMGIRTTETGKVLNDKNEISQNIYALGSLLRGVLWETTAVPEIREQAESIAKQIIESI